MKRNILTYGLIAGLIIVIQMIVVVQLCYGNPDNFEPSAIVGYGAMIVAFSMVFFGIRDYRDTVGNGRVTFGKAFKTGAIIAGIAATVYVVSWLFYYYLFVPDFMEKYTQHVLVQASKDGATQMELAAKTKEMQGFSEMYKNPLLVILFTYLEVLPVGLLITLISAGILRKSKPSQE